MPYLTSLMESFPRPGVDAGQLLSDFLWQINLLKLSLQTNFFYQRENFWSKYENRMAEFILKDWNPAHVA